MRSQDWCALIAGVLALASLTLSIISVATVGWLRQPSADVGLFQSCSNVCEALNPVEPYVRATAAFMIIGLLDTFVAFVLSLIIALGKAKKKGRLALGCLLLFGCICFLIASAVYTGVARGSLAANESLGYSLWMAWSAFIILFVATPVAFLAGEPDYSFMS